MLHLPLSSSHDIMGDDDSRPEVPLGTVAFQQRYLQRRLEQLQHKARVLEGIAEGLPSIGKHVALEILHCCLLASCVYLLRGLHLDATLPWSGHCDVLFQNTWFPKHMVAHLWCDPFDHGSMANAHRNTCSGWSWFTSSATRDTIARLLTGLGHSCIAILTVTAEFTMDTFGATCY